ncbi:MAG: dienelactone hydrolase family protein [Acidimicrobiales bacterium]
METFTLPSGTAAVVARPDGDQHPALGLVVIPDIGGLRPLFVDLVGRLSAEQGWSVVVVDPFPGRSFPPGDMAARFAAMPGMDDERLLGDVVDAAAILATERVGCIGFCMGGMYALKATGTGAFARVCAFYGQIRVPEAWEGPGQGQPLDHLGRAPAATRVMAVIGGRDHFTPPADVDALRAAGVDVASYPDAEHGFVHDPSRPAHRAADAADAWRRVVAFLRS